MRRFFLGLAAMYCLASCNNNNQTDEADGGDTIFLKSDTLLGAAEMPVRISNMIWQAAYDSGQKRTILKQLKQVNPDTLDAKKLIEDINRSWDDINMEFRKISHDTLYVAIPESNTLTQQMGSSGAYNYMSSATYSLTELRNIKFVNYDFQEGDHMAPGTMQRKDFKQ